MSWPVWNQSQAVPQVDVTNMGTYTQEQWALMQQQNWEQWCQWQQQYTQWHAQFGDKYTEQMKNLPGGSTGAQPPLPPVTQTTDVPPPPPDNPPPQPVLAPGRTMQYNQTSTAYNLPAYNASVAPPAVPPVQTSQFNSPTVAGQNYSGYGNDKQSRIATNDFPQGHKSNLITPDKAKFNEATSTPVADYQFNNKAAASDGWRRRNTYDQNFRASGAVESLARDNLAGLSSVGDGPSRNVPVAVGSDSNSGKPITSQAVPDYAEEERQFDLQFKKWEEEFFKWKEHNINHPDRTAYDEYEKSFEACRAQLLERKEQMRLKRMNERPSTASQLLTVKENNTYPPKGQISQDDRFHSRNNQSFDATNDMHNDNPYLVDDSPDGCDADRPGLFPKTYNSNDGIPGLDLVPEDGEQEPSALNLVPDIDRSKVVPQKPDFSAISKGIDNILGDRKLLQMLSMVRQKSGTTFDSPHANYENKFAAPRWSSERENGADINSVPMDTGNSPNDSPPGRFNQKIPEFQLPDMNKMPPGYNPGRMPLIRDPPGRMSHNLNQMPGNKFLNQMPPNRMSWNANQPQGNSSFQEQNSMSRMSGDFQHTRMDMNQQSNNQRPFRPDATNLSRNSVGNKPPPLLSLPIVKPNMDFNLGSMNQGANPNISQQRNPNFRYSNNNDFQNDTQPFNEDYSKNNMGISMQGREILKKAIEEPAVPAVPGWVNQPILEPVIVIDYNHKSDKFSDYDFLEPVEVFDYGHLPKVQTQGERGRMPDIIWDRSTRSPFERPRDPNIKSRDTDVRPRDSDIRSRDTDTRSKDTDMRFKDTDARIRDTDLRSRDTDNKSREYEARNRDYPEKSNNYSQRYKGNERNPERERDYLKRDERSRHRNDDRGRDDYYDDRSKDGDRGRYRDRSYDRRERYDRRSNSRERSAIKKPAVKDKTGDVVEIVDVPVEVIEIPDDDIIGNTIVMIDDLLEPPGREVRPRKIAIILRGLPGSGKSYLAKLIKDREIENGGSDLRILSLDDYFISEVENNDSNAKNKITESKYQYDKSMENTYITLLQKSFRRTVSEGFFSFIIVDSVNNKLQHFDDMLNAAKTADFKVYVCEMDRDPQTCFKRNIHERTLEEIEALHTGWQEAPDGSNILDTTTLLQTAGIDHVQMEDVSDQEMPENEDTQPVQEDEVPTAFYSKWDRMDDTDKLALLDGTSKPLRPSASTMEDFLQLDEWEANKTTQPGKKSVRWADIEEKREQEKMRAIGFVVGQTNWQRMTDPTQGSAALTQTKYIERVTKRQ